MNTPSTPHSIASCSSEPPPPQQQQQRYQSSPVRYHFDFNKRDRFDRADTSLRCREVLANLRRRVDRTRFLSLRFDLKDLPDGDKLLRLVDDLRAMSADVVISSGGAQRASYDTRRFKETTLAAVRSFLRKAPLADVLAFADKLQPDLAQGGFVQVEEKTMELISSLLKLAAKKGEPFVILLLNFFDKDDNNDDATIPQPVAAQTAAVAVDIPAIDYESYFSSYPA